MNTGTKPMVVSCVTGPLSQANFRPVFIHGNFQPGGESDRGRDKNGD